MGNIITIEEYRKRRCLEALLDHIGLPAYCSECDDNEADVAPLFDDEGDIIFEEDLMMLAMSMNETPQPHHQARIIPFRPRPNIAEAVPDVAKPVRRQRRKPASKS
jgi:hypothetical protein